MATTEPYEMLNTTDAEKLMKLRTNCMKIHTNTPTTKLCDIIDNYCECDDCVECDKSELCDLEKNVIEFNGLSAVQQFYHGKNILITGATGFLGKILLDKLLRCCPGIENLYLLVRQKRGKDIYTRIDEIFDDPVFSRLRDEVPKFRHKIVVIPADCEAAGLGLTLSDRQMLIEKVNIIFHSAATVKFDEHLRAALVTNVRAPLHLLRLARDMKGLNALMHISTAYSNSHLLHIKERFYPCEASCDSLHQQVDKMTDAEIDDLLPTILGPWPNTYTYTKALAEKEIRLSAGNLPIGIFRPAIVTSTAKEPLKGWIDNMYGPTGVAVGSVPVKVRSWFIAGQYTFSVLGTIIDGEVEATGMLRTLNCCQSVTADVVPVDFVVNCLISAAVNVSNSYTQNPPPEPPIFNYVSSVENKISWGDFLDFNLSSLEKYPFSNAVWYISLNLSTSRLLNNIYILFLHLLPATLVDGLAICLGRKPKMLKVYRKIHKFSSVISYFCTREIQFCNARVRELWRQASDEDKKLFPFSMAELDWSEYFQEYIAGLRRYLFRESDDTLPQARIKWKRLYYLHQVVRTIFYFFMFYALWWALSLVF